MKTTRNLPLIMIFMGAAIFAAASRDNASGAAAGAAAGQKTAPDAAAESGFPQGRITVEGTVRLVGSALFSSLVITDKEDRSWYIEGKDRSLLEGRQQAQVIVTGTAEYEDVILADGKKAGVRRFLRNIKVEK